MNLMNKKKILILTPRFPYPVIGGDRLRIFNICKELSQSYSLTLLSLCESKEEMDMDIPDDVFSSVHRVYLPKWKSYLNCLYALPSKKPLQIAYYHSNHYQSLIKTLSGEHDLVIAHLIRVGDYIKNINKPKILEMTDAISLNYERVSKLAQTKGFKNFVYSIEQNRLKSYEQQIVNHFDCNFLVSSIDKAYLSDKNTQLKVCSNGVNIDHMPYDFSPDQKTIVFIGNMNTVQNLDAARWFAQNVLPLLRQKNKSIAFKVVGRIGERNAKELSSFDGVLVTGSVQDIPAAVQGASVGVCPMRLGAGVQNKVLEYMAMGIPTVTSSLGLEGIEAVDGEDLLVADSIQEYVDSILLLLSDLSYGETIAKKARLVMESKYQWSAKLAPYVNEVDRLLEHK